MSVPVSNYPKPSTVSASWQTMSYVSIGILWVLSHDSLSPTDYKIRKIKDLGSIKGSIAGSHIDLFAHQIEVAKQDQWLLIKVISTMKRAVALLAVFVFAAPLGSVWHLGNSIYYTVLWIKTGKKSSYLSEHFRAFLYDSIWTLFTSAIAYDLLISEKPYLKLKNHEMISMPLASRIIKAVVLTLAYNCFLVVSIMSFGSVDAICRIAGLSNKPICLKEHFGIVGESGWLLTFNPIYDTEMCSPGQKSGTVQLSGHFYQILRDKAWDVLIQAKVIVQNLDLKLEESDIKKFSKKPKQFLSYLDSRTSHAPLKEQAIESIDEFRKSLNHYQAIADMLSRLFPSTVRLADFIVSPNLCYCYFVYEVSQNDNDLESLENFNRLLENVKTLPPLPNTKYNQLDNIKTDILNAETPRQVLKVDPSASEEECIKAYRSLARQTHPDKILEEPWREQANALFKVIAAAYAHIKVPQTEIQ